MSAGDAAALPHVQVVRGTPDDVELAALVAGLVAASVPGDDDVVAEALPHAGWADRARTLPGARGAWRTGPDAWRRSLR
ncbi:acyl-CoA carboxylase epsilon subunit [Cellulomonas sp. GbtcB1]|uniref:acyl-CoA carboxylase epsilon subunit n=1 Tax=Cellulomonas sp. GbtcB1 TaxID=2824746 RepID=UPI0027E1E5B5|nr:acyl-CoA carboxylase epsilon subunit [Cellulomonas sp. GbtcB1]